MRFEAARIALFLDFDGVLADIAPRPDLARVDPATCAALAALHARLDGALAIVTGRAIDSVDARLAPFAPDVAGLHGAEWRIAGARDAAVKPELFAPVIAMLRAEIGEAPGVIIEDKGGAVALHWREAPQMEFRLRALAALAAQRLGPIARLQPGNAVIELAPAGLDKGAAIRRFLECAPYAGRIPVFAGDDVTDEAGFAAVESAGGVSVRVGPGRTRARWRVATAADWRARLAAFARGDIDCDLTPADEIATGDRT